MKKTIVYIWVLTLLGLLLSFLSYPHVKTEIVIHFNAQGYPDGYAPKWVIFLLPLLIPAFDLFLRGCRRIDPKRVNYKRFEATFVSIRILMATFAFMFFLTTIIETWKPGSDTIRILPLCMIGVLISTLGNVLPKIKANYFIGIRTPWTLMSERVWNKTHRVGGRAWFVGGFIFFIMAFIPQTTVIAIPVLLVIILLYPFLYSYIIYRKYMQEGEKHD